MREALYDPNAAKATVDVRINADLHARAAAKGLDASSIAERALAQELERIAQEELRAQLRAEVDAYDAFVEEHGSFADLVRAHHGSV